MMYSIRTFNYSCEIHLYSIWDELLLFRMVSVPVKSASKTGFAGLSVTAKRTVMLLNLKIVKTHYNLSDVGAVTLSGEIY
jgi:Na+-transporting NADH:ubiquinone oxidoreductase subunit NqrF